METGFFVNFEFSSKYSKQIGPPFCENKYFGHIRDNSRQGNNQRWIFNSCFVKKYCTKFLYCASSLMNTKFCCMILWHFSLQYFRLRHLITLIVIESNAHQIFPFRSYIKEGLHSGGYGNNCYNCFLIMQGLKRIGEGTGEWNTDVHNKFRKFWSETLHDYSY